MINLLTHFIRAKFSWYKLLILFSMCSNLIIVLNLLRNFFQKSDNHPLKAAKLKLLAQLPKQIQIRGVKEFKKTIEVARVACL